MSNSNGSQTVKIRRARLSDARRMAELSHELGYPTTTAQMAKRLKKLQRATASGVFVAESPEAGVVGWGHVSVNHLVDVGTRAEMNGIIVSEKHRSLGAGAQLMDVMEDWARKRGCPSMSVRSNVIREHAHKFYERQGYEHYKTQKAFRKPL